MKKHKNNDEIDLIELERVFFHELTPDARIDALFSYDMYIFSITGEERIRFEEARKGFDIPHLSPAIKRDFLKHLSKILQKTSSDD